MAAIIAEVGEGGDAAVLELTERFDRAELRPERLRVDERELEASVGVLEPDVLAAIRTAIANVRAVAEAQLREPAAAELPEGQRVEIAEPPVGRVGLYVPGGRAAYPSTVVMLRRDRAHRRRARRSRSALRPARAERHTRGSSRPACSAG